MPMFRKAAAFAAASVLVVANPISTLETFCAHAEGEGDEICTMSGDGSGVSSPKKLVLTNAHRYSFTVMPWMKKPGARHRICPTGLVHRARIGQDGRAPQTYSRITLTGCRMTTSSSVAGP